jgi:membrane-associated phospholipid phosphatase
VHLGVHWPLDVVGGAAVGVVAGAAAVAVAGRAPRSA